jgi:hypothetical protein
MNRKYSYDEKCYELAQYFLQDSKASEDTIKSLAQALQDICEDYCYDVESGQI